MGKAEVRKIYGGNIFPAILTSQMVEAYYRFNTGSKYFQEIPHNSNFSIAVDSIVLKQNLYKKH